MKCSIEIEIFKRATHQTPSFCAEFCRSGIENFKQDWNFQSRLIFFNLWALRVAFLVFLAFFVLRFSFLFLCVFSLFSKDFKGSAERKILAFFGGSSLFLAKKQGLEGQGYLAPPFSWTNPKGPKIEKFNLAWKFQSWPWEFPTKNRGLVGGSLEIFTLAWKFQSRRAILNFFNLWARREVSEKSREIWNEVPEFFSEICFEIRPEISSAPLAGRKVFPPNFTGFFPSAISNFKWNFTYLEDRNLLKLRSLDSSCPFFLSDNSIWGQWTQMLQMLWSQG